MTREWQTGVVGAVFLAGVALTAAGEQGQGTQQSSAASRFVGTWRLVSYEANGKIDPNRGPNPKGLIYYDATGHMAAQIAPDRPRPSWPQNQVPPAEQAREAVIGYTAYFGTYTIDEGAKTVTHRRQGALNFNAVDYVRRYEFAPDGRLVLTPLENPKNRITWERIR
jgi:hypothetical protein